MIRAILVVGWLGMAMLLWAALTGHAAVGHLPGRDEASQHHLIVALFPSAALLVAAIATATLFCTGYPTYSGLWPPWIHLTLVIVTALSQLAMLIVGGRAL